MVKHKRVYLQYIDIEEGLVSLCFRTKKSLIRHFNNRKNYISEITYLSQQTPHYMLDRLSKATVDSILSVLQYYDQVANGWEKRAWINFKQNTTN